MRFASWLAVIGAMGLGAAGILGAEGCTVTTSTGAVDDSDGGSVVDNPDTSTPTTTTACGVCLIQGCRGQWSACAENAECLAIYNCTQQPQASNPQAVCASDPNCVQACYDAHPNGDFAYNGIADCDNLGLCTTCQTACNVPSSSCVAPTPDAGTTPGPDASTPETCDSCVSTNCSAEKQACAAQTDCDLYTQCLYACADQACLDTCSANHASGKAASASLGTCTTNDCGTPCGLK